jgi:hypothetical protein
MDADQVASAALAAPSLRFHTAAPRSQWRASARIDRDSVTTACHAAHMHGSMDFGQRAVGNSVATDG